MTPIATSTSQLGDAGANGAQDASTSSITNKLAGIAVAAKTAGQTAVAAATSSLSKPSISSKETMNMEAQYGAHK